MKSRGFSFLVFLLLVLGLVGCQNPATQQGGLTVLVEGPQGLSPSVVVVGPDGSSRTANQASNTFSDLPAGEYTIRANPVDLGNYRYGAAEQTATVSAGGSPTATVRYTAQTGVLRVGMSVENNATGAVLEVRRGTSVVQNITAAGNTVLTFLEPGEYQVVATQRPTNFSAAPETQTVQVVAGSEASAQVAFASGFGSMNLVLGAPSGVTPSVLVEKQGGGYSQTFTASTLINNLVRGTYTLTSNPVTVNGIVYNGNSSYVVVGVGTTVTASINYAPVRGRIVVSVSGLSNPGDAVTVTLDPQPNGTTPLVRNGNGEVSFAVPFGTYTVRASTNLLRTGIYFDQYIGYGPSAPVNVTAASPIATLSATMTPLGISGRLYTAGNGDFENTGWTSNGVAVSGTRNGEDAAYRLLDGATSLNAISAIAPAANQLTSPGIYRIRMDADGNMYVISQYVSGVTGSPGNRIVRIGRANLEQDQLLAGTNGGFVNTIIDGWAFTRVVTSPTRVELANATDVAFDASGNLWIVNQAGGTISCVAKGRLEAGLDRISAPHRILVGSGGTPFTSPRALEFDPQGNLWVAGGSFAFSTGGSIVYAYLERIPASSVSCPASPLSGTVDTFTRTSVTPDVHLNLKLNSAAGEFYEPASITLSPDGQALWLADYGAGVDFYSSTSGCSTGSVKNNTLRESVIRVPLSGTNVQLGTRDAVANRRITVGLYNRDPVATGATVPDRGLQQATDIGFDSRGNLWISANNNINIDSASPCYPYPANGYVTGTQAQRDAICSTNPNTLTLECPGPMSRMLTDRRGKLYVIAAADLATADVVNPTAPSQTALSPVTPLATFSSPVTGVGFTGVWIDKP